MTVWARPYDARVSPNPLLWLNVVGLSPRLLPFAPNLASLAVEGVARPLAGVVPAVTTTAQATALTGLVPSGHGVVGNGWFFRDTGEVRFWQQSNALIQGETVYAQARRRAQRRGETFTAAKLFWWFNQGAPVDWSVTPKPWYGADGSKVFGIHGDPSDLPADLERSLGPFPFHSFWGPMAGLPATEWIADAAARVLREHRPTFTMVYLPHLDYDLQRLGPKHDAVHARVREVDAAAGRVLDAARETGTEIVAFSEYGILPVDGFERPNLELRRAGLLSVRDGPFGETLDTFRSRAFAVCDHQVAHVYVRDAKDCDDVASLCESLPRVARVLDQEARVSMGLEHERSGDLVLLSRPDSWFAYPYWQAESRAPDFARTVDIHRKPGYDPLELFLDPAIRWPKFRVARRLLRKKLGMRMLMDVVPLDPSLVQGSHGVLPLDAMEGAVFIAEDGAGADGVTSLTDLKDHALRRIGLA